MPAATQALRTTHNSRSILTNEKCKSRFSGEGNVDMLTHCGLHTTFRSGLGFTLIPPASYSTVACTSTPVTPNRSIFIDYAYYSVLWLQYIRRHHQGVLLLHAPRPNLQNFLSVEHALPKHPTASPPPWMSIACSFPRRSCSTTTTTIAAILGAFAVLRRCGRLPETLQSHVELLQSSRSVGLPASSR